MELKQITQAMNNTVAALGGQQAALDACDRMYSATFRSEPFPLRDAEGWELDVTSLTLDYARERYLHDVSASIPERPTSDDEHAFDCYYCEMEAFDEAALLHLHSHYPAFTVNGDTMVVETCNYKGEGEGLALLASAAHYPVFTSKQDSFYQANG